MTLGIFSMLEQLKISGIQSNNEKILKISEQTINFQFFIVFSQTWLCWHFYSYMKIHLDQIKTDGKFRGGKNQVSKIQNS